MNISVLKKLIVLQGKERQKISEINSSDNKYQEKNDRERAWERLAFGSIFKTRLKWTSQKEGLVSSQT